MMDDPYNLALCLAAKAAAETPVADGAGETARYDIIRAIMALWRIHHPTFPLLDAIKAAMPILDSAESNASGNPEFDYVGPRVAAVRAAVSKIGEQHDPRSSPTDGGD